MSVDAALAKQVLEYVVPFDRGKTWRGRLDEDLSINEKAINIELAEHPAKFAWWASLHVLARARRDDIKRKFGLLYYELKAEYVKKLPVTEKKPTKDMVDEYVETHKRYQEMEVQLLDAGTDVEKLYVAREAMTQRRDSLIAMATNLRRELDVDPGRKAEHASRLERDYDEQRNERSRE